MEAKDVKFVLPYSTISLRISIEAQQWRAYENEQEELARVPSRLRDD